MNLREDMLVGGDRRTYQDGVNAGALAFQTWYYQKFRATPLDMARMFASLNGAVDAFFEGDQEDPEALDTARFAAFRQADDCTMARNGPPKEG